MTCMRPAAAPPPPPPPPPSFKSDRTFFLSRQIPKNQERIRLPPQDCRAGEGRGEAGYRAIVAMEWFDVQLNRPIDPQKFIYQPAGIPLIDTTEAYLKTLNLATPGSK